MANIAVRANSVKHLEKMSICCKSTAVRGFVGSKMVLRTFAARRITDFDA
jgi:hypothetical protein